MPNQLKVFTDTELTAMVDDIVKNVKSQSGRPAKRRKLSPDQVKAALGTKQAVRMNFIPMMLASLAVEETKKLLDYASVNKVSDMKKHSRAMRNTIANYEKALTYAYGPAYKAYLLYVRRFLNETALNVWKMELQADSVAKNQQAGILHPSVPAFALIVSMIVEYCEEYDTKADNLISEKLNIETNRRKDVYLQSLLALCSDILCMAHYHIDPDESLKMWIGIISNQAWRLVESIIDEEDAEN